MMTFREMKSCHIAQVAELEALCFNDPWPESAIASELKNPLSVWLVALEEDVVVGYVGSQTAGGETDMMNIAVHPDHRRRGIARALVERLIPELKKRGSSCLALEVRVSNAPALVLYEKMGFQQEGLRKNYYRNPKEDAYILRKHFECL